MDVQSSSADSHHLCPKRKLRHHRQSWERFCNILKTNNFHVNTCSLHCFKSLWLWCHTRTPLCHIFRFEKSHHFFFIRTGVFFLKFAPQTKRIIIDFGSDWFLKKEWIKYLKTTPDYLLFAFLKKSSDFHFKFIFNSGILNQKPLILMNRPRIHPEPLSLAVRPPFLALSRKWDSVVNIWNGHNYFWEKTHSQDPQQQPQKHNQQQHCLQACCPQITQLRKCNSLPNIRLQIWRIAVFFPFENKTRGACAKKPFQVTLSHWLSLAKFDTCRD